MNEYSSFIDDCKRRCILKNIYTERHHIIPRCLGGSNESHNLIELLPEEHLTAHYLLAKYYPSSVGLQLAFQLMCDTRGLNPSPDQLEQYKCSKEAYANYLRVSQKGEGNYFFGKSHSKDSRNKMSNAKRPEPWNKGKSTPSYVKKKISESCKGKRGNKGYSSIYCFIKNNTGEKFIGTRSDFANYAGMESRYVSRLFNGKQKTVKGWSSDCNPPPTNSSPNRLYPTLNLGGFCIKPALCEERIRFTPNLLLNRSRNHNVYRNSSRHT